MTQQTPTVSEINSNLIAQLQSQLNQTIPLLPRSFLRVLSKAVAGVFVLSYKYGGFIALQQFVSTATIEPVTFNGVTVRPLVEWGRLSGTGDPVEAEQTELTATVAVTATGTLSGFTQLTATTGVVYLTTADTLVDADAVTAGSVSITVRASSDPQGGNGAGIIGNLPLGSVLSFVSPPSFAADSATVSGSTVTGANTEPTEVYRRRVLRRFQRRPQGGALVDYQIWSEEVAGVINAYPYTGDPGEVDVYVEVDNQPNGIPTADQLTAVENSINMDSSGRATRRPANALADALAITRTAFNVSISGLSVDNQALVRGQIEDAVTEYFTEREPFITGVSLPPRADRITNTAVSAIVESLATASNGSFTSVTITRNSTTVTAYTLSMGEKAALGMLSYV